MKITLFKKEIRITTELILKCLCFLALIAYVILLAFGKFMFGAGSAFYRSLNIFSGAGDPNVVVRLVSYVFFCLGASWIVRFVLKQAVCLIGGGSMYLILRFLLAAEGETWPVMILIGALYLLSFWIYDFLLGRLSVLYVIRLQPRFNLRLK